LEQTHHYVQKYAPDLIEKAWPQARDEAAAHAAQVEAKDRANESRQGQRTDLAAKAQQIEAADRANPSRDFVDNNKNDINEVERPTGTSAQYAHRRLRKDRPDIHQRVLAGELSPHAGMIEGGFRKRPVRRKASPLDRVRRLLPLLSAADRAELRELIDELDRAAEIPASAGQQCAGPAGPLPE
jgi:hypothetical protein